MKRFLFAWLLLTVTGYLHAAGYTGHVEAGKLRTTIETPSAITELKLSGSIDARDFAFIADSLRQLHLIDLSDCHIAALETRVPYLGNQTSFKEHTIPANALFGMSQLISIKLPRATTKIDDGAFAGCPYLMIIDWGEQLQEIGAYSFANCTLLSSPLPANLQRIGEYAFQQCAGYTSMELSHTAIESIGAYAFHNCAKLTTITLPATLHSLGNFTFAGCTSLREIELPRSISTIGKGCFAYCDALKKVDMATCALRELPPYTFDHCRHLESVKLPETLTQVGEGAFYYCTYMRQCTLPGDTQLIDDYAFAGSGIAELNFLPQGLEEIGDWAFYNATYIYWMDLPETLTSIGEYAFGNNTRLCAILSHAAEPPHLGENVFQGIDQPSCRLGVPDESVELYRGTPQWKEFDIALISHKEEIKSDQVKAYFAHKNLIIQSTIPLVDIRLCALDGRTLFHQQKATTELTIDTQPYTGEVFILSVQKESGEYSHLKLGRAH